MIVTHLIDGKEVQPPLNVGQVSIKRNFVSEVQTATFSSGGDLGSEEKVSFDWPEQAAQVIMDYYNKGVTGGAGVTEGLPHKIMLSENGNNFELFNGFIDLKTATFDRDLVSAESMPLAQIDWLNKVADAMDFQRIAADGFLTPNDRVAVPYVISRVPDYTEIALMQVTLIFCTIEIIDVTLRLTANGGEAGTIIDSLGGVIGLIFTIIYAVILLATLISLIIKTVLLLIQPIKYKMAVKLTRLMEAACAALGLTFESTILYADPINKAYIIPESLANTVNSTNPLLRGFTQQSPQQEAFYRGTIGQLFRNVKTMVNGKYICTGSKVILVPRVRPLGGATVTLPPIYNPQFTINAADMVANYNLSFEVDNNDLNTIDFYQGVAVSAQLKLKVQSDKRRFNLSGFSENRIGFARATRKFQLTQVEEVASLTLKILGGFLTTLITIANTATSIVNKAIGLINKIVKALKTIGVNIPIEIPDIPKLQDPKIGNLIEDRRGVLLLEKDTTTVAKIVLLEVSSNPRQTKIPVFNDVFFSAKNLYELYHKSNSYAPTPDSAQRIIKRYENVELSLAQAQAIMNEEVIKLSDGTIAEVRIIDYTPETRLATLEIGIRKIYANNLTETIYEPTGI
jgi:hypothetical protein